MQKTIITVTLNPCLDKTITLDGFCEGGLNRAEAVRTDAGGKGINVAKVLARFGSRPLALGFLGQNGRRPILEELENRGIAHDFCVTEGNTRTNYKLFDRAKQQVTEVNEPGFAVEEPNIREFTAKLEEKLQNASALVLAGSCPTGVTAGFYGRLTELARQYRVKTILDADGDRLAAGLSAKPYAIKPNRFELEQLHGGAFDDDAAMYAYCRKLLDSGVGLIVLSMGSDGAAFLQNDEAWRVHLAPVSCQSTVGAGDSMTALTAYGLERGLSLSELARLATAAGTMTASKPGTEVCTAEEVQEYKKKLRLEKIW